MNIKKIYIVRNWDICQNFEDYTLLYLLCLCCPENIFTTLVKIILAMYAWTRISVPLIWWLSQRDNTEAIDHVPDTIEWDVNDGRIADTCLRVIKSCRYTRFDRRCRRVATEFLMPMNRPRFVFTIICQGRETVAIFSLLRFCVAATRIAPIPVKFAISSGTLSGYIYDLSFIQIILQRTLDLSIV